MIKNLSIVMILNNQTMGGLYNAGKHEMDLNKWQHY